MTTNGIASPPLDREEYKKRIAWSKTQPAPLWPAGFRVDCDGVPIQWNQYGKLTEYGWEIDHIHPTALGGPDAPHNVRARHWRGNRSAGGILSGILGLR